MWIYITWPGYTSFDPRQTHELYLLALELAQLQFKFTLIAFVCR